MMDGTKGFEDALTGEQKKDHLAIPDPVGLKAGAGPNWGHWVSHDFLHWARLPVAIWNDQSSCPRLTPPPSVPCP